MTADVAATPSTTPAADDASSPGRTSADHPRRLIVCLGNNLHHSTDRAGRSPGARPPYRFRYLRRAGRSRVSWPFQLRRARRTYTSPNLFPLFSQRIMNMRRPDFKKSLGTASTRRASPLLGSSSLVPKSSSGHTVQLFPVPWGRRRRDYAVPVPRPAGCPPRHPWHHAGGRTRATASAAGRHRRIPATSTPLLGSSPGCTPSVDAPDLDHLTDGDASHGTGHADGRTRPGPPRTPAAPVTVASGSRVGFHRGTSR